MGVITTKKSLVQLEKLSTASFCRRRLAVVVVRLKMSETLREAATFIEQVDTIADSCPIFIVRVRIATIYNFYKLLSVILHQLI